MANASIAKFSDELAVSAAEAGKSVVTVFARPRVPSSGVLWRPGVVVTVDHAIQREDEISVLGSGGKRVAAKLAGRDPACDLAVLKIEESDSAGPIFGDPAQLKLANVVLALGRTRWGNLVASSGIIGGLAGESRTWRGGKLDLGIRLDLELYPGFSGGPLVDVAGKVLGINSSGLGRGRPITIPLATVNRSVDELLAKGYVARPYLGIAMQPVRIPENSRAKLSAPGGLIVLHVEPDGPAGKAGIVLGDVIVELEGKSALGFGHVRSTVASHKIGDTLKLKLLRAGAAVEASVKLEERPAK